MNKAGDAAQTCTFYSQRGERITVRAIGPQDAASLQTYIRGLSSEARRNRFHGAISELSPTGLNHLIHANRSGKIVLLVFPGGGGERAVIGEAILAKAQNSQRCEIALSVADAWQSKGIGTLLLRSLECRARVLSADALFGEVLRTNTAMKCLARKEGFSIRTPFTDARLVEVCKDMSTPLCGVVTHGRLNAPQSVLQGRCGAVNVGAPSPMWSCPG
jgi:GNAT superfamily N-acetyltransferase